MSFRITSIAVVLSLAALSVLGTPAHPMPGPPFTVHEWGTFTSMAGEDGTAVEWAPQGGPQDLPCFVRQWRFSLKGLIPGTVRMETPVVYFYAPEDLTVSVSVRFRQGAITEWYPSAEVTPSFMSLYGLRDPAFESSITWPDVRVVPRSPMDFPVTPGVSHYYTARETDASPIEAGNEREKFLFYRGVGGFEPPVTAAVDSAGNVTVTSVSGDALGDLVLFENRDGRIAYQPLHVADTRATFDPLTFDVQSGPPLDELERSLIASGLYPREASAIVETWRDSWFDQGARLFYIAPRQAVDAVLPLEIVPEPTAIERVFVGRIELVTPEVEARFREAVDAGDKAFLQKRLRFAPAIMSRVFGGSSGTEWARASAMLGQIRASLGPWPVSCEGT
jgi:hypothetical protein